MLTQTQQQLSKLNSAYFAGELNFGEYRRKRGLILDSLFDDITIPKDLINNELPTIRVDKSSVKVTKTSNKLIILTIVILFICIAAAVTFLIVAQSPTPLKSKTAALANAATQPMSKLKILVEKSISQNIWTAAHLKQIELLWNALPAAERSSARKSLWYPKFSDTLKSLSMEQKALVDIGNNNAVELDQQITRLTRALKN